MNEQLKSATYTFIATFLLTIVPSLQIDSFTEATWKSAVVALLLSGVRAGIKAFGEKVLETTKK